MSEQIAKQLNDVYWRLYWAGELELCLQLVDLMRACGIDENGRWDPEWGARRRKNRLLLEK